MDEQFKKAMFRGMNCTGDSILPNSGIWREVMGIVSDTLSWNTVSESSTVTPKVEEKEKWLFLLIDQGKSFFYKDSARVGGEVFYGVGVTSKPPPQVSTRCFIEPILQRKETDCCHKLS